MGFAPITNPAIVVVVTLNGTHGESGFGGAAAAPVFHQVATEALRVLDVPKDLPDDLPSKTLVAKNLSLDDSAAITGTELPNILDDSEDDEEQQHPEAEDPTIPRVPDFKGKTMRAVLTEAAARGLTVLPDGSGVARVQVQAPGSILHDGERIRVRFSR
jgi:cell division protein FtsI (penicillin-binding protein 3)